MAKTQEEVRNTAAKYARDPTAPLRYQLNDVPLEAWEVEFPVVDMCLRDSIRLNLLGTAMRRNISGKAIPTGNGNEVIPPGAFVTYATGDIHLDPDVYVDPHKWDPARYLPERAEDKKKNIHGFVGWGVGRHPCCEFPRHLAEEILTQWQWACALPSSSRTSSPRTSSLHLNSISRTSAGTG
jgi:sterol 14-demethylase